MKNIIVLSALFALVAVSAQAQGKINFNNDSTTKIFTNKVVGGASFGITAGPYRFALFCSTNATSVNGQTTAIVGGASSNYAFNDANWTLAGYGTNGFPAGFIASVNGSATTVPGVAGGASARFVVIGWSANAGADLAGVQSWFNGGNPGFPGWIGQSDVSGAITLGTSTGATLFGTSAPGIHGFTLGLTVPAASVAPVITLQPTNTTVPTGAGATFTVGAYGSPTPAFQWLFNATNIIPGATGPTLTINNAQATNAGTYSAIITNTAGSTNSFAATLTVSAPTGDGYVFFYNGSASSTKIYTNSSVGGAVTGLTEDGNHLYYYALYASASSTSVNGQISNIVGSASSDYAFNDGSWTLVAYGTNSTRGVLVSLGGPIPKVVSGIAGGTSARFVVVGWSANIGTDVEAAQTWFNGGSPASDGWIGQSAVSGSIMLGNGGVIPAPTLFGASAPYLRGFTLGLASPVPSATYPVPSAPPALVQTSLNGNGLQLSWPAAAGSFGVQSAPSPAGPWSDTGLTVGTDGANSVVTVPPANQGLFFRLVTE